MAEIRVLVVDDSVVVRRLVSDALGRVPGFDVVGVAANGRIAVTKAAQLAPDVITMDIEMPELDGIGAVRELRRQGLRMPVVMFSTLTERGAAATLDALAAGASDYVTKPSQVSGLDEALTRVVAELVPRLRALVPGRGRAGTATVPPAPGRPTASAGGAPALRPAPRLHPVRALLVGSSTGGPEALSRLMEGLTAPPRVPALVVQHMPPVFTRQLATRLDRLGPARVVEAEDGMPLEAGTFYVAPGDRHLVVRRRGALLTAGLDDGPPVSWCRPSVDVLLSSAVDTLGGELLAVVLTGMGADGRTGAGRVVEAGGTVAVQDEATSVVWGMPGAVALAGLAHHVVPLGRMAATVEEVLAR